MKTNVHTSDQILVKHTNLQEYNKGKFISNTTGLVVGVPGRDDAGKSTFLNHFAEKMPPIFRALKNFNRQQE
jgi:hypothetical protein